jgi:hypothetical protein
MDGLCRCLGIEQRNGNVEARVSGSEEGRCSILVLNVMLFHFSSVLVICLEHVYSSNLTR